MNNTPRATVCPAYTDHSLWKLAISVYNTSFRLATLFQKKLG